MHNIQIKILKALWDFENEYGDERVCYYKTLEKETGLTRKELSPHMRELRLSGHIMYIRGLIDIEGGNGGYYGSGHQISSTGRAVVSRLFPGEFQGFDTLPEAATHERGFAWIGAANDIPISYANTSVQETVNTIYSQITENTTQSSILPLYTP